MSDGTSWVGATAKQISRAVRRGDVSATQVVADTIEQITISDPSLDAFRVIRGGDFAEISATDRQLAIVCSPPSAWLPDPEEVASPTGARPM